MSPAGQGAGSLSLLDMYPATLESLCNVPSPGPVKRMHPALEREDCWGYQNPLQSLVALRVTTPSIRRARLVADNIIGIHRHPASLDAPGRRSGRSHPSGPLNQSRLSPQPEHQITKLCENLSSSSPHLTCRHPAHCFAALADWLALASMGDHMPLEMPWSFLV